MAAPGIPLAAPHAIARPAENNPLISQAFALYLTEPVLANDGTQNGGGGGGGVPTLNH